ncbi:type II secretion system F family protein [Candidatus Parcubacteria bacterium]|nr:type II secretion system F family protein [Candidatus Parcubacteria bacterium]
MKFKYQARTEEGEIQEGVVEAGSRESALNILENHNLFVTSLIESSLIPIWLRDIKIFNRVSQKDIVIFSRQLSMMFEANVPLVESLETLGSQQKNPVFKEKVLEIAKSVEGGTALSEAFSKHPDIFSPFYVNMIKSGEASGKLSEVLKYLAERLEKQYEFMSKIKGAMIYPLLVIVVSFVVIGIIIFFVMPQFAEIFGTSGQELPLFTKIVLGLSEFFRKWLLVLMVLFLALLAFVFFYFMKTKEGKEFIDKHILSFPFFGDFLKMFYLSRFAQNLSTLIAGGLPIAQALRICSDIVNNNIYKRIIVEVQEGVKKGKTISSILLVYPDYFPPLFSQMVSTGEKTGQLEDSLSKIATFFQKEVERMLDNILSVIEPALIVFLALIVGGIAAAVFIPMYNFIGAMM